jgi:hypothetical protein
MTIPQKREGFLVVELTKDADVVQIHGDAKGLLHLIERIQQSIQFHDHQHLMTESWGGVELNEEIQGSTNRLLHRLDIFCWPQESIDT